MAGNHKKDHVFTVNVFEIKKEKMKHVIIGNGIAGISVAETIRKSRSGDEIIMIGNESVPSYWRANLTKYILGSTPEEKMRVKPEGWLEKNEIHPITGEVRQINSEAGNIIYQTGDREDTLEFDRLCVATGASPIMLKIPGHNLPEVLTYRSLQDANYLKSRLRDIKRMVVIGGGVLGLEVVEITVKSGIHCTIFQLGSKIGLPLVDDQAAEILLRRVTGRDGTHEQGAEVMFDVQAKEFLELNGHVQGIRLKDDSFVPCDMVVICIGIAANPQLFENSGLSFECGLVVDAHQQTSVPGIYGAGDCVIYPNESGQMVPTRTWVTSRIQGKTAGFNMCDIPCLLFDEGPMYNASYLFDMFYTVMGEFNAVGEEYQSYSSQPDECSYRKIIFKNDRVVGAMMLGNRNGDQAIRRLIAQNVEIVAEADKKSLLDPAFDPNDLATQGVEYIMY
ncbi:MAG: NAD(P)/FAD-dependent oxidoreductase [SAR324 cluster bacterium]|nr:NAD(P)/FAD-dependent oxidoreductase [SAR324 cluster bacterium]